MILTDIKSHASALGVAACVGILLYLLSLTGNNPNKTEQTTTSSPGVVQEGGTPSEILGKIKTIATPSMREKAAQGYVGIGIEWHLYLQSISKLEENNAHFVFSETQDLPHNTFVKCLVSLNDDKILNEIEKGMLIKVIGQISQITPDNDSIELTNVMLKAPTK